MNSLCGQGTRRDSLGRHPGAVCWPRDLRAWQLSVSHSWFSWTQGTGRRDQALRHLHLLPQGPSVKGSHQLLRIQMPGPLRADHSWGRGTLSCSSPKPRAPISLKPDRGSLLHPALDRLPSPPQGRFGLIPGPSAYGYGLRMGPAMSPQSSVPPRPRPPLSCFIESRVRLAQQEAWP